MIIGLTGKNASGKGEAAELLKKYGYQYRSLSDALREEAALRGLPVSRDSLIQLGRRLREEEGPGVLAIRTVRMLRPGKHVIDSIRNTAEIEVLKKSGDFLLIGIDAPVEIRFQRALKRGRDESAGSFEEFKATENRERTGETLAQQLDLCLAMADRILNNDGTIGDLEKKLAALLAEKQFPAGN